MRYYLVVGEASGDLHASHLMASIKECDPEAEFRYFGGDLMKAQGGKCFRHYKNLAYMGFIQIVLHARTILKGIRDCKLDILAWLPDVVILVDYPGFNLRIAHYVNKCNICPVIYYIPPKIWAWKEFRIKKIKKYVDMVLSILPFEIKFYEEKHGYHIQYVGNPSLDEIEAYKSGQALPAQTTTTEKATTKTGPKPTALNTSSSTIAILAGSRKQEIRGNLRIMLKAAEPWMEKYEVVIAGAPGIEEDFYQPYLNDFPKAKICFGKTFELLSRATAALVVSGTASLEAALFEVPQVVCYNTIFPHIACLLRPLVVKTQFISLVNLILDKDAVPELVTADMCVKKCRNALATILPGGKARSQQLRDYAQLRSSLGETGAPVHAAKIIFEKIQTPSIRTKSPEIIC